MFKTLNNKVATVVLMLAVISGGFIAQPCFAYNLENNFATPDPIVPSYINQPFTHPWQNDLRIQNTQRNPQNPYFNHNVANPYFNRGN